MKSVSSISAEYVVVGCGIAGLRAAIELGESAGVLVLAKAGLSDSATEWAQGGIAAALSDEDEISLHEQDTVRAGDGLCHQEAVRILVEEGLEQIQRLIEWGTQFDRSGSKLAFTREGAHSRSRILHAHGDSTGREISRALFARARSLPNIQIRSHAFTTELLTERARVVGLLFLDENDHSIHEVRAGAVLLATGGLGQAYRETTNPEVATGDGMAIAYHAGAALRDLEFVQFHPTALAVKGAPRFLLSEALRGEGAILRNADLERFMKRYHESLELAPRDVVARAIVSEMHRTGTEYVYLDMTAHGESFIRKRFPRIHSTCLSFGLDISTDLVPVRPAAHYAMGGVKTDLWGRSTLPGLYAAGETAGTGVHGANRLASNSLLEGLVFGARAGAAMRKDAPGSGKALQARRAPRTRQSCRSSTDVPSAPCAAVDVTSTTLRDEIRTILWKEVGIIRDGSALEGAFAALRAMELQPPAKPSRQASELYNLWTLAQLITRSALARRESRGSHYRSDFPFPDDENFRKHSAVTRESDVVFE